MSYIPVSGRPIRLQKYLAESGVASRRASEKFILAGRVSVNGSLTFQLGTKVHPDRDLVSVDGEIVSPRRKLYVALHKPPGVHCTRKEPARPARKRVGEFLPKEWQHLFSVGRLDAESEGLILLTNDGEFSNRILHPRYGARKVYLVTVEGRVPAALIPRLREGVVAQGEHLKAEKARLLSANKTHSFLELTLAEGKNREIRRLLAGFGFKVVRLKRTQIGPVKLGQLPSGKWRTLTESEIKSLLAVL
jgi:23S rRNA pseudouridine2605 synthase